MRVSHKTPAGEVWVATGHGITVKSKNPESAWALEALDRGFAPLVPVRFENEGNGIGLNFRTVKAAAAPALKAREYFSKLTTQEAV
jgi:hypothetical protein